MSGTACVAAPESAIDTAASRVRRGEAVISRGPRGSVVTRAYAESPLKWLTPANRGHAAWLFAASYGGGLVGGDHLGIDLRVEAGAAALLSTQASTKVYRSAAGASMRLAAHVADGALLVSLPDSVVCFAASSYRQVQDVSIDPGGALVAVDWMASGRRGSGERWAFDDYASRTSLRVAGRLALRDAVRLSAIDGDLAERLGRINVLAVVVIAGETLAAPIGEVLDAVAAETPAKRPPVLAAAAPLPAVAGVPGCVVRLAGESIEAVRDTIRRLLAFVPARLGDDPWARKW